MLIAVAVGRVVRRLVADLSEAFDGHQVFVQDAHFDLGGPARYIQRYCSVR